MNIKQTYFKMNQNRITRNKKLNESSVFGNSLFWPWWWKEVGFTHILQQPENGTKCMKQWFLRHWNQAAQDRDAKEKEKRSKPTEPFNHLDSCPERSRGRSVAVVSWSWGARNLDSTGWYFGSYRNLIEKQSRSHTKELN